jgi:exodeoxyribonuclease V alpha subunit
VSPLEFANLPAEGDPFEARFARRASGLLQVFNEAGVLAAADVHVALRLARLAGDGEGAAGNGEGAAGDDVVLLGAAFAVRAPRLGHVCVDLASIHATASSDLDVPVDVSALPWPDADDWVKRLGRSGLAGDGKPLRIEGDTVYLDRYWDQEGQVAADLLLRADRPAGGVDVAVLSSGLTRMFGSAAEPDLQRLAAASAVLRQFAVIAGGPGTGKTTTIARVLALLAEQDQATGRRPSLVGLAAPTGKAAARLEEAVHDEAWRLDLDDDVREHLLGLRCTTIHRLLGWNPGNRTRFRHNRLNRLAHDVIVVDETSMVSLSLMARLVEAVRADARLVLVGDPEQLASVEAGAVLGDLVGPASHGLLMRRPARTKLSEVASQEVSAGDPPEPTPIGDGIVVLRRGHRFAGGIADLASAIQAGDADSAIALLDGQRSDLSWLGVSAGSGEVTSALEMVRTAAVEAGRQVVEAARAGLAAEAIAALGTFRVLCAHRLGPAGAATWMARVQAWLATEITGFAAEGTWYAGRPLLVTANDYGLRLYNGDTGVVVASPSRRLVAAFERGGQILEVSPTRLASVDTVYAMTIHKSQGSQFNKVAVVLPEADSPILTRELLYTAVTRARQKVILVGTEAAVRVAVGRPIARSSGLGKRLWKVG